MLGSPRGDTESLGGHKLDDHDMLLVSSVSKCKTLQTWKGSHVCFSLAMALVVLYDTRSGSVTFYVSCLVFI